MESNLMESLRGSNPLVSTAAPVSIDP
jgi:hypothetical protein